MENKKIQQLLDKEAIRELAQVYCRAADRQDVALMGTLYHDDATDDHGMFFKGLARDFLDKLPEIQEPMQILHHNVTNHIIELDGDRAEGEVYILAFHQVSTAEGLFDLLVGGRYLDHYEKRAGVWKFAMRAVLADWVHVNEPSQVDLDHPLIKGSHIGSGDKSDPSYTLLRSFARLEDD